MPDQTPFRHIRFPDQPSGVSDLEQHINNLHDGDVQAVREPTEDEIEWENLLWRSENMWHFIKDNPALWPRYKRLKRMVLSLRMIMVRFAVEPNVDGHGYGHLDENGQFVEEARPPVFIHQDMNMMARAARYWEELSIIMEDNIHMEYVSLQAWIQWQEEEPVAPLVDLQNIHVRRLIQLELVFQSGRLLAERPWLKHWVDEHPHDGWAVDDDIPALPAQPDDVDE